MFQGKWSAGRADAQDALDLRMEVFVEEQGFAREVELDEYDDMALHALVYEDGQCVATGRLIFKGDRFYVGRVAVKKAYRGQGFGDLVMRMILFRAEQMGVTKLYLHAQLPAMGFYEKLGFKKVGGTFLEEGAPHQEMMLELKDFDWHAHCREFSAQS